MDKHLDGRETQPPSRYGQGTLIELMEKHNLGTKATRHNIIQNLYDRGYIDQQPGGAHRDRHQDGRRRCRSTRRASPLRR